MVEQADRRQQILEGALQVFSTHGFHKANIKMIAKAAGIKSSALIYHYFEDKEALLQAIVREMSPLRDFPIASPDIAAAMMQAEPHIVLHRLLSMGLTLQDNPAMMQLIRVFVSEAATLPQVADAASSMQRAMLDFLRQYLRYHITLGHLREHDIEVTARVLIGTIIVYVMGTGIFPAVRENMPSREDYVNEVVNLLLQGINQVPR